MVLALKHTHIAAVVLSVGLFVLRGLWMLAEPKMLELRWVRIVPHVIDTVLLTSAIALAFKTRQAPWSEAWLAAKVVALPVYVALGTIALKRGRTKRIRTAAFAGALVTVGYIVAVALTRSARLIP